MCGCRGALEPNRPELPMRVGLCTCRALRAQNRLGTDQHAVCPNPLPHGEEDPSAFKKVCAAHELSEANLRSRESTADLSAYSQAQLDQVAQRLNERPRRILGFEILRVDSGCTVAWQQTLLTRN